MAQNIFNLQQMKKHRSFPDPPVDKDDLLEQTKDPEAIGRPMEKHHSCLNTKAVIEHFQENFPTEIGRLLEGLGPEIQALPDPVAFLTEINNWVSSEVVIRLFENAKRITHDPEIIYKIGFESAEKKKLSYITRILLFALRNPRRSLRRAQQINDKLNKNKTIELVETTRDSAIIRLHWFKDIPASKDFCIFNQGVYTGLPTVWNLPPAEVKETKCYFDGDDYCEYHCKWKIKPLRQTLAEIFVPWRALHRTIEEMEQDKGILQQKFDEVHKLYIQLQEANLELEQKNLRLNENQEQLHQAYLELEQKNLRLNENQEQLRQANLELEQKNLRLNENQEKLSLANIQLNENQEQLRQNIAEINSLYLQLQKTNQELEEKNISLNENQEQLRLHIEEINNLNRQLNEKINNLKFLQETGVNILNIHDQKELFSVSLRMLRNNARLKRVGIFLVDEERRGLKLAHAEGVEDNVLKELRNPQIAISKMDNIIIRVYNTGQAAVINEVSKSNLNKNNPILRLLKPEIVILAPLTSSGKVIGVLLADRDPAEGFFTPYDEDFVISFANQMAIALVNANLIRQKENDAEHLRKMFEIAKLGHWRIDANKIIREVNSRLKVICGADDLTGKHVYEFLDADNQKKFQEIMAQNEAGRSIQDELEITTKSRQAVTVRINSVPLFDQKEGSDGAKSIYDGSVAIIDDISDQKKMEKQLQQSEKMDSLGRLASGIAHEFKNILQTITSLTDLMLQEASPESDLYKDLIKIKQSSEKGADIVQQILIFSRDEKPQLKPISLSGIVKDGLKMVRAALPTTVIIQPDIDPNAGEILGDATQVHQVLLNLCTNAAHAMRDKVGRLNVNLENVHLDRVAAGKWQDITPGDYVQLTVTDNGVGMDKKTQARIFEPFFTTKEQGEGTGMGLSKVHSIIKAHGGAIDVESTPGVGTTFRMIFPMRPRGEREVSAPGPKPLVIPTGKERILFVDDELTLTTIIKKMLERLGYEVVAKSSSVEALETFRAHPENFDLLIADYTMPHITGVDLAHKINLIRPDLPIILCTGVVDSLQLDGNMAGIREVLTKPVTIDKLAQVVRHTLDAQSVSLH